MENKHIVLMYSKSHCDIAVPFVTKKQEAYMIKLFEYGKSQGVMYYRSGLDQIDLATAIFKKVWSLNNQGKWEIVLDIKASAILDHTTPSQKIFEDYVLMTTVDGVVPVCNQSHFRRNLGNKLTQYILFNQFMSPTYFLNSKKQLQEVAKKDTNGVYVKKPLYGQLGNGVSKGIIKDFLQDDTLEYPFVLQKFINSTINIKGTNVNGFADLRLTFINNELIYALSRVAAVGSFITNLDKGGHAEAVNLEQIPSDALEIANKVKQQLSIFKTSTYCIDFLFENGKAYIVEMNTRPSTELLYKSGNMEAVKRSIIATTNQCLNLIS